MTDLQREVKHAANNVSTILKRMAVTEASAKDWVALRAMCAGDRFYNGFVVSYF
jgi:hypothetical protein